MFMWMTSFALAAALAAEPADASKSVRVLIVTGCDHPAHKWRETAPELRRVIEADPRCSVRIVEDPDMLDSAALRQYDVIVLHFMNWKRPDPSREAETNLQEFVAGGKGLVVIHFACGAFPQWPEFANLAGRVWDQENTHDPRGPFRVEIVDREHPITRGVEPYETVDELYICLTGDRPVHLLASARSKKTGRDHPMAFCFSYGEGRVFHTPLGHDTVAISNEGTARLIRQGCLWAAGAAAPEAPP